MISTVSVVGRSAGQHATHVELGGLQPDVFALWAHLASLLDDFAGGDHLLGVHLESGSGDPSGRVLWVRLDDRVQKRTSSLDVSAMEGKSRQGGQQCSVKRLSGSSQTLDGPDLRVRLDNHRVEVRQVALGVDRRRRTSRSGSSVGRELQRGERGRVSTQSPPICSRVVRGNDGTDLIQLERQDLVSRVSNLDQVCHRSSSSRCVHSVGLPWSQTRKEHVSRRIRTRGGWEFRRVGWY